MLVGVRVVLDASLDFAVRRLATLIVILVFIPSFFSKAWRDRFSAAGNRRRAGDSRVAVRRLIVTPALS